MKKYTDKKTGLVFSDNLKAILDNFNQPLKFDGILNIPESVLLIDNPIRGNIKEINFFNKEFVDSTPYVFSDNYELERVNNFPNGNIGEYMFLDCNKLKSITFLEDIYTIKAYAFAGCTSLENICLPSSLITIHEGAFANCTSLKEIIIPPYISFIAPTAFQNTNTTFIFSNAKTLEIADLDKFKKQFKNRIVIKDNSLDYLLNKGLTFKQINKVINEERGNYETFLH